MEKKEKCIFGVTLSIAGACGIGIIIAVTYPLTDPSMIMPLVLGLAGSAIGSGVFAAGIFLLPVLCPQPDEDTPCESHSTLLKITTHAPPPAVTHPQSDVCASRSVSKDLTPSPFPSLNRLRLVSPSSEESSEQKSPKSPLSSRQEAVPLKSLSPIHRVISGAKPA